MNRRKFLKILGSSSVILAAGATGFVVTRHPSKALAPWEKTHTEYDDPMRHALSYAILAPNPHNRQPWVIDLHNETEATLYCDLDRLLPETDPFSRQIMIGLGCFLELFSISASQNGYKAEITYFPEGNHHDNLDQRPVATLSLKKQKEPHFSSLFPQILNRRTNREPYDLNHPIDDKTMLSLKHISPTGIRTDTVKHGQLLADLRILTRDALITETRTPAAHQESVELMRIGRSEIEANPDGISLGGAFLETLHLSGVLSRESLADPKSSSFQIALDMINASAMSAMGFAWIISPDNSRLSQLMAGRSYMQLSLKATEKGLAMQPMSQALQEYPAMIPYLKSVHEKLVDNQNDRVQMLVRLGYAKDIKPSPRWPLETRIKNV